MFQQKVVVTAAPQGTYQERDESGRRLHPEQPNRLLIMLANLLLRIFFASFDGLFFARPFHSGKCLSQLTKSWQRQLRSMGFRKRTISRILIILEPLMKRRKDLRLPSEGRGRDLFRDAGKQSPPHASVADRLRFERLSNCTPSTGSPLHVALALRRSQCCHSFR